MKSGLALLVLVTACGGSKSRPQQPATAEQEDCHAFLRHILALNDHPTKNMSDADFAAYRANPQAHIDKACRDPEYLALKRNLPAAQVDCLRGAKTSRELDVCYEQQTADQWAAKEKTALAARKPCADVTFAEGTATIRGVITDGGRPSQMTTVIAIESAFEADTVETTEVPKDSPLTVSDDKGRYTFEKLRPGYYTVRFYGVDKAATRSCVAAHSAKPVALDQRL